MVVSASSSASATVMVENATRADLMSPDWTTILSICNSINSNHEQAEEVVKALKKRLQHENSPKVQFLSLMLLNSMAKNCGDSVHSQIGRKKILNTMIGIFKKKEDTLVGEKILTLLDSWQKAFGGKHPHYSDAYEKLRRSGVKFPEPFLDADPTFTPPVTHPTPRITSNSARMLDEIIANEIKSLSLPSVDTMWNAMECLSEILHSWNPGAPLICEMEFIVDLVSFCYSIRKKLMDEELLCLCPVLNSSLLSLLAKCEPIVASGASGASGAPGAAGASGASGASGARVVVIGSLYCRPSTVELEISREAGSFVVRHANRLIFRVERERDTMRCGVLVDVDNNSAFLIKKQIPSIHGRWVVYKGRSDEKSNSLFKVRRPEVTGEKTKLVVFLAADKDEKVFDFKMEESRSENLPVIYSRESSILAETHKKAVTEGVSTSEDITVVKIYPNIDIAFIVTLVVIHKFIKEIGEQRQEYFRRAGEVAGKVALVGGSHAVIELIKNSLG